MKKIHVTFSTVNVMDSGNTIAATTNLNICCCLSHVQNCFRRKLCCLLFTLQSTIILRVSMFIYIAQLY